MSRAEKSNPTPWYRDGLRFTCTGCGDCCTGSPGFVWVNREDSQNLAELLEMDLAAFEATYTYTVGVRRSLKEYENGDCVFFDPEKRNCRVYGARPRQCRTWPFWDSNLRTPADWELTCEACPGSGRGKLHELGTIERQRAVIRI